MNYLFMGSLIEREKKFTGDKQIKAIVKKPLFVSLRGTLEL